MKIKLLALLVAVFVNIASYNLANADGCGWAGCGWNKNDQKTDQGKDYDRNSSVNTDQVTQDSSANDDKDNQDQLVAKH